MNKEIQSLINQFHIIARKRWIPSVSSSFGSIGITFEQQLNKKADSLYFPDYYGIEIKCTSRYSRYPLFLFTIAFDGTTFPEINRIVEKYGYYDTVYTDKKVLYETLRFKQKTIVNDTYQFQLELNKLEEKIYLCVYDMNDNLIEKESFVYLKSISDHLLLKLNTLAIIYASQKTESEQKYFRYYKIAIYKLTDFETFLKLLETDKIEISLISRIGKSGSDAGRYRNKNLVFAIKKDKIENLFKQIFIFDYDSKIQRSVYNYSNTKK